MTAASKPWGAMYFPARAFNAYQTWANYDRHRTHRDLAYAKALNLNALRVLASYHYWQEDRAAFQTRFDHLLEMAELFDLQVLPVLFESIGDPPTTANLTDTDVETSFAVCSPDRAVIKNPLSWTGPAKFVRWFVRRYGDHPRVLAVEVMNEPGEWGARVAFCQAMLRMARATEPNAELTMGCKDLEANRRFDIDIYQFHYNIPPTAEHMRRQLRRAKRFGERFDKPVWLTEWQRTREEPPDRMRPNYASLASTIREGPIDGAFLWGLLVKPAYMEKPRRQGRLNGVIHEDGVPYSADDACAIAGTDSFDRERPTWPGWTRDIASADSRSDAPGWGGLGEVIASLAHLLGRIG